MDGVAATQIDPTAPAFGPYRVLELLGRGGMGTVHRAYDTEHRRMVALKRLPDPGADERFRARFRREARIAAGLRHPHAVPVHAFGEIGGHLYLDMLLVEGTDLRRMLGTGVVDPQRAVAVLAQIASVLDAAHAAGLVHRDVKPPNILVDEAGHAYLADFGIARPMATEATDLTGSGAMLGTWDYLAPERLSGDAVDGRADQYALACVLFECLTGRPPYPGVEPAAVVAGHLVSPPPTPSLFDPTMGPALDAVVLRGLAKDPRRRYPSCAALMAAAEQALHDEAPAIAPAETVDGPGSPAGRDWLIRAVVRSGAVVRPSAPTLTGPPVGSDAGPPTCPYPGLRSFERSDAAWFHGRRRVVTDLLVRLAEQLQTGEPVVLIGASGSGKSSVLRAGLLPALDPAGPSGPGAPGVRAEPGAGPQLVCTPGADPIGALAAALAPLTGVPAGEVADALRREPSGFGELCRGVAGPGPARPVVVVDQFEELFSHDVPDTDRSAFATALASASPALVLIAVRADMVERCIELPPLRPALAAPVILGPMGGDELREAIVAPARDAGVAVEPGLPERLVADLGARDGAGYDPAALPRLAHALRETWNQGAGALTLAAYRRAGGVDGAVARTAEEVYSALDDAGREVARTVLLRLVIVPDDGPAVRRRVDRDVLDALDDGSGVLDRLIAARLVTVDGSGARLSHETLLAAWPRLRDWIDVDRAGLVQHRRLTEAAQAWSASGGQPDDLYRGARLGALDAWLESARDRVRLDPAERDFLDRSRAADRVEAAGLRRRTRRLRTLVAALSALLLVAAGAVVVATNLRADAVAARQLSLSRQLAASSELAAGVDPRRAALLALGAWQAAPSTEARSSLLATAADPFRGTMDVAHVGAVTGLAISADGRVAASGGRDGTLRLWDVPARREVARLAEGGGWYRTVSMSADGRLLLAVDQDPTRAQLWDVAERRVRHTVPERAVDGALSPDGRTFAVVVGDPLVVVVRDTTTFAELTRFPVGLSQRVTYSPDGALIATTDRRDIAVNRAADGARLATLSGHTDDVTSIAFDPSGTHLASGSEDGTARLWDVAAGTAVRSLDPVDGVAFSVAYQRDDRLLLGDSVGGVSSWDVTTGTLLGRANTTARGTASIAVSGDRHTVIGGSVEGPMTVWELGRNAYTFIDQAVIVVSPQPRGPLLAAVTGDGAVWLWNRLTGGAPRRLEDEPGHRYDVAFSPDGARLATAGDDGTVRVRDVATSTVLGRFESPGANLGTVAFSPDGTRLATGTQVTVDNLFAAGTSVAREDEVLLLDATRMSLLQRLPTTSLPQNPQVSDDNDVSVTPSNRATALAFSPDGRSLAAPLSGGRVAVWDLADPASPPRDLDGNGELATDAAFTPDSAVLATTGSDRSVRLWSLPDGPSRTVVQGVTVVRVVAFSPDGAVFATASQDRMLRVWSMPDGQPLAVIDRHADTLNDVAFDDTGRLISTGADGSVQVWDLDPGRAAATLCHVLDPATLADSWRALGPDLGDPPRCPG